jgi:copper chaperone CopZ
MKNRKNSIFANKGDAIFAVFVFAAILALSPVDIYPSTIGEITVEVSTPTVQCGMCDRNISKALDKVNGVKSYEVNIESKKVIVTYDEAVISLTEIENAISKAGYDANDKKADKKAYNKLVLLAQTAKYGKVTFISIITCPECGFSREENMPDNACMHFYKCHSCGMLLKPKQGDCCVFCSYGTVKCPSKQIINK